MARTGINSLRVTPTGKTVIDDPKGFLRELLEGVDGYEPGAVLLINADGDPELVTIPDAEIDYEDGELVVGGQKVDADGNPLPEATESGDSDDNGTEPPSTPADPDSPASEASEPAPDPSEASSPAADVSGAPPVTPEPVDAKPARKTAKK